MTTINWIQDSNGNYEISSPEHLKQLMHQGGLYSDSGTPPTNYWNSNYVQTVDIDLLGDSTDIKPIGIIEGTLFTGDYDGAGFRISNWSYLDPTFTSAEADHVRYVGLFGNARFCILKNIVLDGVWTISGFNQRAGFLAGACDGNSNVFNIVCNFSSGTQIESGPLTDQTSFVGAAFGYLNATLVGCTLKGSVDFKGTYKSCGGVIGRAIRLLVKLVRNLATFPSHINGTEVGGIIGYSYGTSTSHCINAMTGNLVGSNYCGGITGQADAISSTYGTNDTLLNAMTGDIISEANAAGIFGRVGAFTDMHTFINYMQGDIVSIYSSGFMYIYSSDSDRTVALTSSIIAMNGSVAYPVVRGTAYSNVQAMVDTTFGMTYTFTEASGVLTTPPAGLLANAEIPSLPYTTFHGTDNDGNTYDFDFVCANISGNSLYADYTHLVLHKGDIDTPFRVDFDVPENNTTLYYTYVNASTQVVLQDLLSVALLPGEWNLEPRSINVRVSIGSVPDIVTFKITYQEATGNELTALSGFTNLNNNVVNLDPETQYTLRLYADTGNGYELIQQTAVTTLSDDPTNYVMADFEESGVFNLTSFDQTRRTRLGSVLDDLLETGDVVSVSLETKPDLTTKFIRLGDSLSIKDVNSVLLPFGDENGTGQGVTVTLSDDATDVAVAYDETNDTISVNSSVYSVGDTFILDGQKVVVFEY